MYKSLIILTVGSILFGAFYYLHKNYPTILSEISLQGQYDKGNTDTIPDSQDGTIHPKKVTVPPPNSLIAESLKGIYVSTTGNIELTLSGQATYNDSSEGIVRRIPGTWNIDDTGTIIFTPDDASVKAKLFDVDSAHHSIIEVSNSGRAVYTKQK